MVYILCSFCHVKSSHIFYIRIGSRFVATSQNAYSCVKPESVKVDTFYDLIREILQPPASMPEECVLALVRTSTYI